MVFVPDPNSQSPSRRFVATQDTEIIGVKGVSKLKKGQVIRVNPDKIKPYISGRILIPFPLAVREGIYPPKKETFAEKITEVIIGNDDNKSSKPQPTNANDTKLVGNRLRDMIQARKQEIKSKETSTKSAKSTTTSSATKTDSKKTLSQEKLKAIKSGGKK
ncbi:MAG: hypothetical protein D6698_02705 [Gammaproteobacteria bacterium]|nr:MAG: hypothetical protein D6698_02705 [Gammaproteobacteria bacterium]